MSQNQNGVESVSEKEVEIVSEEEPKEEERADAFHYFKSFLPVDIPWEEGDPNKECGAPLPCENYPFGCLEPEEQQASLSFVRAFYPCPGNSSTLSDRISDEVKEMIGMGKREHVILPRRIVHVHYVDEYSAQPLRHIRKQSI